MTQGNAYRYELGVHDMAELPRKPVEANIEVLVMDVGTGSKASIYSDASLATAKTNPITTTVFAADKGIKFWCDAGSVDLVLISAGYGSGIFYDVTSNTREIAVNSADHRFHILAGFDTINATTDTGVDLPANLLIDDIWVEVIDEVASSTLDVGFLAAEAGGDVDGLVDGVSCATAGLIRPGVTVTTGSNEVYYASTTRGVMMHDTFTAGSDAVEDTGTNAEHGHLCDGTATSLVMVVSNHAHTGRVHLFGKIIRVT